MELLHFPHCCTARIAASFGQSMYAQGGNQNIPEEVINQELEQAEQEVAQAGLAMVVATTNTEQTAANNVLLARGYSHSKWMTKKQHPSTKVRIWYKHVDQPDENG